MAQTFSDEAVLLLILLSRYQLMSFHFIEVHIANPSAQYL